MLNITWPVYPLNSLTFHFLSSPSATYYSKSILPSYMTCPAALSSFFLFSYLINVTYAAAESEAAELSSILSRPCVAVLLWQQQDEGHSQRQMVEAVDIGVVPLLQ